ncbi:transporter substrate-binding domain-containing protein [Legionella rowbothamii]|uniref:transporter substrate-binding domain-containing protein n=1 Tax=Legionella rowbothamii TaxID=96229 RepID=UPI00105514F5|nr:transporter substrate-binding domain-containing protein [Legionella rowbothamii]
MKRVRIISIAFCCIFFANISYSNTKIAFLTYDPPFVISPHEGFDIDLANMLCKHTKLDCQFVFLKNSQQIYEALKNGQVDLALSGITISSERKKDFIFSLPYMLSKGQFLTLKQSNINSLAELKGAAIGIIKDELSGGVLYSYITNNFPGVFKINQYNSVEDMFAALSNKSIAAVFLYRSDVNYWNHNGSNSFKTIGPVVTLGEGFAIMATPRSEYLISQINKVLLQMEQDSSYLKLYETYFSNQ